MNLIRLVKSLIFAAAIPGNAFAASAATTIAVTGANFAGDKDGLSAFVFEVMQTELSARPDIELVDRKKLHDLLAEQGLGASGLTNEKAARIGKLVGATYYVFGESIRAGERVAVNCRVVQVETGVLKPILASLGKDEDPMAAGTRLANQVVDAISKLSGRPAHAAAEAAPPFVLPAGATRPVLAMRIPETSANPHPRPDPAAEKSLEAFFLQHEFKVVQLSRPSQGVENTGAPGSARPLHLEGPEHEALLNEARGKGADVLILGIATSDRATQIGQFSAARARVEFAAMDTHTSKVLATTSGYGTGTDLSSFVAEKKAIESATSTLVAGFARKIVEGFGH